MTSWWLHISSLWALGRSSQLSWSTKCWMRFYRCSTLANRGSEIPKITITSLFFHPSFRPYGIRVTRPWAEAIRKFFEMLKRSLSKTDTQNPSQNLSQNPVPDKAFPRFTKSLLKIFQNAGPSSSDSGCVLAIIRPGGAATARMGRELSTLPRIKQRKSRRLQPTQKTETAFLACASGGGRRLKRNWTGATKASKTRPKKKRNQAAENVPSMIQLDYHCKYHDGLVK